MSKGWVKTLPVPLGQQPVVVSTPFEKVAIDFGPIKPATSEGHTHTLVLVDYATRYVMGECLKKIDTISSRRPHDNVFTDRNS